MEIRDIAAFGGLGLGLLNIGLYIYKEFYKIGKLEILENNLTIKTIGSTEFDFQLDLKLRAKNENITISGIYLENTDDFFGYYYENQKSLELPIPLNYKKIEIKKLNEEQVKEIVSSEIKNTSGRISDLRIEKNSNKSLSFIDRIQNVRYSDGYEDTPKDGWKLKVEYDKTQILIDLNFQII